MITGLYTLGSLSVDSVSTRTTASRLSAMKAEMDDLSRQLSTGKKTDDFAGLGGTAWKAVRFDQTLSALDGYDTAIADVTLRAKTDDAALGRMAKSGSDVSLAIASGGYTVSTSGKVAGQDDAETRLQELVDLLNTDISGKRLFGGRKDDTDPVQSADRILNGYTENGVRYDGLNTLVSERVTADFGAGDGHLQATNTAGSNVVTLAHDGSAWGFTLGAASGSSGIATSGSGPVTFTVATQPADGEAVSVQLTLPDSTTATIKLVARTTAGTGPAGEDSFVIGATPAATAANLQAAMQTVVNREAATSLKAASAAFTADDFFTSATPTRVNGGNTVQWYQGDSDPLTPARTSVQALIGNGITASVGARANETGPAKLMAAFGALAVTTFDKTVSTDQQRWTALSQRVKGLISQASDGIGTMRREIASSAQAALTQKDQSQATRAAVEDMKSAIEDSSQEEVSVRLLDLQTKLQASYQVTSMLSKLSLVNYMG